jgi:hypothetical protein
VQPPRLAYIGDPFRSEPPRSTPAWQTGSTRDQRDSLRDSLLDGFLGKKSSDWSSKQCIPMAILTPYSLLYNRTSGIRVDGVSVSLVDKSGPTSPHIFASPFLPRTPSLPHALRVPQGSRGPSLAPIAFSCRSLSLVKLTMPDGVYLLSMPAFPPPRGVESCRMTGSGWGVGPYHCPILST